MVDPKHQNRAAVISVLQDVRGTEHLEEQLAVLITASERTSQLRMPTKDVRPIDKLVGDPRREFGKPFVEERRKSIKVGDSLQ